MRVALLLVILGAILAVDVSHAGQAPTSIAPRGETLAVATAGKQTTQVKFETHEIDIGKPSDPRPDVIETNCTYSKHPCSIVDRVQISVNGSSIYVPRSVFADLADLNEAEIFLGKKTSLLKLFGGDGSESYIVSIAFDSRGVRRRTVWSGIEKNKPLQETIYHRVVVGD